MRFTELIKMVFINILSNKSKCALTSLGIVAGSATIVLVIAIGQGGKMDVADQFKNLSAGAVEVTAGQSMDTICLVSSAIAGERLYHFNIVGNKSHIAPQNRNSAA